VKFETIPGLFHQKIGGFILAEIGLPDIRKMEPLCQVENRLSVFGADKDFSFEIK
jgi:hypothetical protein